MKRLTVIIAGASLLFSACKKSQPHKAAEGLPPITNTGANTFGCMINGELFKPKWAPGYLYSQPLKFNCQMVGSQRVFSLAAKNMAMGKSMVINVVDIDLPGGDTSLVFDSPYARSCASARFGSDTQAGEYRYNTYKYCAGELHLFHLYKGNSRVAGTFWFDAVDTLTRDTVRVQNGRFDIGY
jgi:hypothetical protein